MSSGNKLTTKAIEQKYNYANFNGTSNQSRSRGADRRSGWHRGLRTKGSLVRDLAGSPFVVALSNSHLPPAWYWLNTGSRGRTTDLDRL